MENLETNDHGSNVFVFTETITPVEGRAEDVLAISLKSGELLRGQPGLIQYMVAKSEKSNGQVSTTTVWAKKTDFQNFMKTDAVAALLKSNDMANIKTWMSDYNASMSSYVDGWHP